jgi:hypothetical protein
MDYFDAKLRPLRRAFPAVYIIASNQSNYNLFHYPAILREAMERHKHSRAAYRSALGRRCSARDLVLLIQIYPIFPSNSAYFSLSKTKVIIDNFSKIR